MFGPLQAPETLILLAFLAIIFRFSSTNLVRAISLRIDWLGGNHQSLDSIRGMHSPSPSPRDLELKSCSYELNELSPAGISRPDASFGAQALSKSPIVACAIPGHSSEPDWIIAIEIWDSGLSQPREKARARVRSLGYAKPPTMPDSCLSRAVEPVSSI